MKNKYITNNEYETKNIAEEMSKKFKGNEIIFLYGKLGAGKSVFAKGIAKGLGIDNSIVRSPSYTLVNVYEGKIPMYHIDFYRIGSSEEIYYIGFDDFINQLGIVVIEWPQKVEELVEEEVTKVYINIKDKDKREIKIIKE